MISRLIFWPVILVLSLLSGVLLWYVPLSRVGEIESLGEVEVNVTIPEGRNFNQVAAILVKKHLAGTMEEVLKAQREIIKEGKYKWLEGTVSLEGYLFPDTYRFYRKSDAKYALEKMLQNFEKKAMPVIENNKAGKFDLNFKEVLILASIIEKESTREDRALIADILIRRLKQDIPLQVDASVNYVTGLNKTAVSVEETKIDSPYNTYKYRGLPPGPISNPGLEAIRAVLNPKPNIYWYYLSTKDGKIIYSRNLEEHNKNKAIFRNFAK